MSITETIRFSQLGCGCAYWARDDVLGETPFRTSPGNAVPAVKATVRVGNQIVEAPVKPGVREVAFKMSLPAGATRMSSFFTTREGVEVGAFYAYVRKK